MHEIITLQLGQRSNYLATHFWNTQESYFTYSSEDESLVNHDIHFRPGIGSDGTETFTPRTVIYDLKGGFGSLRKINALYELDEPVNPQGLWSGPTVVQRQTAIQQSAYQQSLEQGLEPPQLTTETVRYWSDFNRVFFHPRSIIQLNEYELGSALMPFEHWNTGEDLFNSLDKEHDLLDRDMRLFAEEADQMQGIQIMSGIDDAWGGFAARYVDRIRDEYGKTAVWFWGNEENSKAVPREKRFTKLSNTARSISEIAPLASLFIPMTIPSTLPNYVTIDTNSQWNVSALMSTALESMTLPSRLHATDSSRETLDRLTSALNINGNQNIARLRMSIDQNSTISSSQPEGLGKIGHSKDVRVPSTIGGNFEISASDSDDLESFDIDFFPAGTGDKSRTRKTIKSPHVFGQTENYRLSNGESNDQISDEDAGYERSRRRAAGLPIVQKTRISLPFPLLNSFPQIFNRTSITPSLAVNTSLSTDTTVALRVKELQFIVSRAVGIEEREALSNALGEIAEAYEEGWDSGSDEDDD